MSLGCLRLLSVSRGLSRSVRAFSSDAGGSDSDRSRAQWVGVFEKLKEGEASEASNIPPNPSSFSSNKQHYSSSNAPPNDGRTSAYASRGTYNGDTAPYTLVKGRQIDDEGNSYFEIGRNRRVTVRSWQNVLLLDIREWFVPNGSVDGRSIPSKKGISLRPNQWRNLCEQMKEISSVLNELDEEFVPSNQNPMKRN